ncbi:glycosyltransferase family 2 protein [Draconibacterium halophilum]|uniref:Glycosyltransferase n=1 Tax=Draconibacterium halophilum TaxID=2706887 RepID=A0A6C0RFT0_9BACT|nr:glycosyltransferase family 2 protein [Draconibacterium halophilum]QIA08525.1 glycosyltransferase [Draconibacterium halophilum]
MKKKQHPLISIITIVKNGENSIEKTIKSVLNQSYKNIEYIIIDGLSTDNTVKKIEKYSSILAYWESSADKGISEAFNKGINHASGEYLLFLNSGDTFFSKNSLETFIINIGINKIITGFSKFGKSKIPKRVLRNNEPLYKKALVSHQSSLVHKDVFKTIGNFNTNLEIRMDYEFWLRAMKYFNFTFIDHPLINYECNGISGKNLRKYYLEELTINRVHLPKSEYLKRLSILLPALFLSIIKIKGIIDLIRKHL